MAAMQIPDGPPGPARLSLENALADALDGRGQELARDCVEAMYRDPFWMDRFGERGRRFADEDGVHHVRHLAEALRMGEVEPMARYARWLQSVLVSRGMCTAHIDENLARLSAAIEAAGISRPGKAFEFLGAAREALVYAQGPARELQLEAAALAERTAARARAALPALAGRRFAQSPSTLLSYLADAIAASAPQLFAKHVAWARDFAVRRGGPRREVATLLEALEHQLPPDLAAAARPALRAARKAVEEQA